jgi:Lrp/AsnC family transcriptional regulator for asnA, asnC and gidA
MDKLDYLILAELLSDARLPFLTIAKKIGVSPYTVKQRYEEMKQNGIIRKSIISIDLSKLGYQGKVFLMITVKSGENKAVTIHTLEKIRNIISISEIVGTFDIIAIAPITDFDSIKEIVLQIKELPSVQRVEVACINDTAFPISPTFGKMLSQKSRSLAAKQPR